MSLIKLDKEKMKENELGNDKKCKNDSKREKITHFTFIFVLDQSVRLNARVIGHRHLGQACQLGGLVELMGHVNGPQSGGSFIYIRPDQRKSACGVYSTFECSTSKYSLKTPKPKSARVFWG